MKVLQLNKKKISRLRVIASLLTGTVLITPLITFAQENAPQLSEQEYELDQKRRISDRLQEIENEKAAKKAKEASKAEKPTYYVPI
ncbi:MAG: hypothetical protein WAT12_08695, partial [Candidatus Nitrotoga sp.]